MAEPLPLAVGDRVRVLLDSEYWRTTGWFEGTIVRIEPYSAHRSFYWVELARPAQPRWGGSINVVSILNPKHIFRA